MTGSSSTTTRLIRVLSLFGDIASFMPDTLHWLPIQQNMQFKILTLICNRVAGSTLTCLRDFCSSVSWPKTFNCASDF